jgi:hypothetical protein
MFLANSKQKLRKLNNKFKATSGHEGKMREKKHISSLYFTSPPDEACGKRHVLAALPPERDPVLIVQEVL